MTLLEVIFVVVVNHDVAALLVVADHIISYLWSINNILRLLKAVDFDVVIVVVFVVVANVIVVSLLVFAGNIISSCGQ